MNTYTEGEIVDFTFVDTDASNTPVDPSTLTFKYRAAGRPTQTLTYSGTSTPTVGQIARTSTGNYLAQIDTTGLAGNWTIQWQSTGVGQTTKSDSGKVVAAPL